MNRERTVGTAEEVAQVLLSGPEVYWIAPVGGDGLYSIEALTGTLCFGEEPAPWRYKRG